MLPGRPGRNTNPGRARCAPSVVALWSRYINALPDTTRGAELKVIITVFRRLFEVLPSCIELEIVRVIDTRRATHSRYGVRR